MYKNQCILMNALWKIIKKDQVHVHVSLLKLRKVNYLKTQQQISDNTSYPVNLSFQSISWNTNLTLISQYLLTLKSNQTVF